VSRLEGVVGSAGFRHRLGTLQGRPVQRRRGRPAKRMAAAGRIS
jgi:ribosomal protein L34